MNPYQGNDSMTTTNADGRARKSLAEQIDRLDAILDGLSEALTGAVTAAVTEAVGVAVKEAVQGVLAEALTNPALQEKLRGMAGPPPPAADPPPVPSAGSRLKERLAGLGRRARSLGGRAGSCLAALWQRVKALQLLGVAALALGAGVLAGVVAHLAGWPLAPAAAGLVGLVGRLVTSAQLLVRQASVPPASRRWA
jgi:hypothetical protein